MNKAV